MECILNYENLERELTTKGLSMLKKIGGKLVEKYFYVRPGDGRVFLSQNAPPAMIDRLIQNSMKTHEQHTMQNFLLQANFNTTKHVCANGKLSDLDQFILLAKTIKKPIARRDLSGVFRVMQYSIRTQRILKTLAKYTVEEACKQCVCACTPAEAMDCVHAEMRLMVFAFLSVFGE